METLFSHLHSHYDLFSIYYLSPSPTLPIYRSKIFLYLKLTCKMTSLTICTAGESMEKTDPVGR